MWAPRSKIWSPQRKTWAPQATGRPLGSSLEKNRGMPKTAHLRNLGCSALKSFHKSKVTQVSQRQKLVSCGTRTLLEYSPEEGNPSSHDATISSAIRVSQWHSESYDPNLSLVFPGKLTLGHLQLQPVPLAHGSHETEDDATLLWQHQSGLLPEHLQHLKR